MVDDDAVESRVERLLERILESGESPEEACRLFPELLPAVRAGLLQLRQLEEQVSGLFPPSDAADVRAVVAPQELPVVPGYEVQSILGYGGMGIVYRARHLRLNRPVALKMILSGTLALPAQRQRFLREAEAVAAISHAGIVQVYNAGETDCRPWFTMELVGGGSLSQKVNGTPQPARRSAALVADVAEAMAVAHEHGIVHRDLKPSNILLTTDGKPKVADFGLARWADEGGMTLAGSPVGTPGYMAPEQARGDSKGVGPETDVYSLGAILYELLTGRAPFRGETPAATIQQVLNNEPVPPSRLNPRVPRDLQTICLKCLQKQPAGRYADAGELAADLGRFLRHEPIRARPVGLTGRLRRWAQRHPGAASMTGALVVLSVVAVALIVRQWRIAENARANTHRMATRLVLDRGVSLCERGEIGQGLLWLAGGLEQAEKSGETDLIPAFRANLGAWSGRLVVPRVSPSFGSSVTFVEFHPKGKGLLIALNSNLFRQSSPAVARVLDPKTWKPLGPSLEHPQMIRNAHFSPDGSRILTADLAGTVRLWDAESGRLVLPPLQLEGYAIAAFAPDGKCFATGSVVAATTGEVRVWETATGKAVTPALATRGRPLCLAFSPGGNSLAVSCSSLPAKPESGEAEVWDSHSGRLLALRNFSAPTGALAFSPDGQTIATGSSDGLVLRWRPATSEMVGPPLHHPSPVRTLAFTPDGRGLLTGNGLQVRSKEQECAARLWDLDTGRLLGGPWIHPRDVWSIALSPDRGSFATGSEDGHVRIFPLDAVQPKEWQITDGLVMADPRGPVGGANSTPGSAVVTAFSPDGRQLLVGGGTTDGREAARLVDVLTGEIRDLLPERKPPQTVTSGRTATTSAASQPAAVVHRGNYIEGVAFDPKGGTAVDTGQDGRLDVWDVKTGRLIEGPRNYGDKTIPWMRQMPDEHTLISGARDRPIEVWDRDTGKRLAGPIVSEPNFKTMVVSPDGKTLATASDGGVIQLWDVRTGILRARFASVGKAIWSMRFSPDGRTLAAGGWEVAWLFDASTGVQRCPPMPQTGTVWETKFSPDGRRLLTVCSDEYRELHAGTAQLWDARSGRAVGPPLPHRVAGLAAAFDPQGHFVATGGFDGDVRLWDAVTGIPIGPPLIQNGPIPAIAFVAGTNFLAAAEKDGKLALWPVPQPKEGSAIEVRQWVRSFTGEDVGQIDAMRDQER